METEKTKTNEKILNLTLEIIFLLTGEDYTVVKKTGECKNPSSSYYVSGGWSRSRSPITQRPPHSLIPESNNEQKILNLIHKMTELLTGEVPIRCQDVAVYFSLEEWEYIEGHQDRYEEVIMEKHRPLTSPAVESGNNDQNGELKTSAPALSCLKHEDGEILGNEQEIAEELDSSTKEQDAATSRTQCLSLKIEETPPCDRGNLRKPNTPDPVDHTMCGSPHFMEEPYSCNEGNISKPSVYTVTDQTQYPSTHIKEEPVSRDGGNFTAPVINMPIDHTHHLSTHIKEEPVSRDGGNFTDPVINMSTDHTHHLSTHIKEEPVLYDGENITDHNSYIPTDHTHHPSTHIQEEPVSRDGKNLTDHDSNMPIDHTHHPSTHIQEKPVSYNGESITDPDTYTPRDHTHHPSSYIRKEAISRNEALTDTKLYTPIDQSQYVFPHIQKEPVSGDGRSAIDLNIYTPPSNTQLHPHSHIKEEPYSCDGVNVTDPDNHTQQYPSTHIKEEHDEDLKDANSYTPKDLTQYRFPRIKKEAVLCNGASLTDLNIHAAIDSTQQYRSAHIKNDGGNLVNPDCIVPTDRTQQFPSREEPLGGKSPSLQKPESTSLRKPEDKHVRKRKKKEQNYNDISISEKYFCTIQQTTNSLEILYNCPECPECFTSNLDLAKHQIIHTGGMPFICSICGRCFGRKSDLVIHQTTHGGSNEFGCPYCELSFPTMSSLSIHETTHGQKRPLPCPECGKTFPTKKRLTRHRQVHTDERPFKCPECGDTFKRKAHLQRHQAIHEKARLPKHQVKPLRPKPFQSSVNKRLYNLKLPSQVHHRLHTFQCLECSKSFSSKSSLQMHQRIHGSGQSMTSPELKVDLSKDSISSLHLESFTEDPVVTNSECGNHSTDTKRKKKPPCKSLKSLPCPVCGKCFLGEYKLKRHHSIHTREELLRRASNALGP